LLPTVVTLQVNIVHIHARMHRRVALHHTSHTTLHTTHAAELQQAKHRPQRAGSRGGEIQAAQRPLSNSNQLTSCLRRLKEHTHLAEKVEVVKEEEKEEEEE